MLNYEELDPGIRQLVRILNNRGFVTTDSGDGYSKDEEARVFDQPHVCISLDSPDDIIPAADRLIEVMATYGVEIVTQGPEDVKTPCIQVDYCPVTRRASMLLMDVLDEDLKL